MIWPGPQRKSRDNPMVELEWHFFFAIFYCEISASFRNPHNSSKCCPRTHKIDTPLYFHKSVICVKFWSIKDLSRFFCFHVSLTVYLSITLVNDQLDAQILIHLLQSSICTCFEQYLAHPQEDKLY